MKKRQLKKENVVLHGSESHLRILKNYLGDYELDVSSSIASLHDLKRLVHELKNEFIDSTPVLKRSCPHYIT